VQLRIVLGQSQGQIETCIFSLSMDENELEMLPKNEASSSIVSDCDADGIEGVLLTASCEHEADVEVVGHDVAIDAVAATDVGVDVITGFLQ